MGSRKWKNHIPIFHISIFLSSERIEQTMWQRFTERARRLVFFSQEEAGRLGESFVATEHLLLGLCREHDHVAAKLLERMSLSLSEIRGVVEQRAERGEGKLGQDMQLSPESKTVIDLAYAEAKLLDNNYIGTEHILLGLLREEKGMGGRILRGLGVSLEVTREMLKALQSEGKPAQTDDLQNDSQLSSFKETLSRLAADAQALKLKMQGKETPSPEIIVVSEGSSQRGDIGVLKNADERTVVEFVPSESDLAAFEDVMRIKDEYAYRELVTSGKVLLLEAGTQAKLLKRGNGATDYIRILSGKLAGEMGYALRSNLYDFMPDDRPFPPTIL